MQLSVLNDIHIGVERSGGTTLDTRWYLRQHILSRFDKLLPDTDLMILGDLFDSHDIPVHDLFQTYKILNAWLRRGHKLILVAGNHDLSKTSNILSSFDMLGKLLESIAPTQVTVVRKALDTKYGYIIPHVANQELFDKELEAVPNCEYLYLHCNYANYFAAQSDQSLNISKEQVEACKAKQIIIGHEHSKKQEGKVLLPGNQIASSVADWQGGDTKYYITDGRLIACAKKEEEYIEQYWKTPEHTLHMFVRVIGDATTEQAAQVVSAIAKFRANSGALVISNAVNIASDGGMGAFSESLESVQAFDIWEALGEVLSKSDMAILKGLD